MYELIGQLHLGDMNVQDPGAQHQITVSETDMNSSELTRQSTACEVLTPDPTFYPFLRLPVELQLQIWKHAIPEPQIITMQPYEPEPQHPPSTDSIRVFTPSEVLSLRYETNARPSALLRACHTSREVLMETHYTSICLHGDQKLYFDSDHDTVSILERPEFNGELSALITAIPNLMAGPSLRDRFAGVKHLAIPTAMFLHCCLRGTLHTIFPSLESLLFVIGIHNPNRVHPTVEILCLETLHEQAAFVPSVYMWKKLKWSQCLWLNFFDIFLDYTREYGLKRPTIKMRYINQKQVAGAQGYGIQGGARA